MLNYKLLFLFILLLVLIQGCSSNETQHIEYDIRRAPDIGMTPCETITELKDGKFETITLKLQEISHLYYKCEQKRLSLQIFIENK